MLPLPVMVHQGRPLALMVELEPRLAWVLAVTTLMATPTPTWVLETLPLAGAAAALPLATACLPCRCWR